MVGWGVAVLPGVLVADGVLVLLGRSVGVWVGVCVAVGRTAVAVWVAVGVVLGGTAVALAVADGVNDGVGEGVMVGGKGIMLIGVSSGTGVFSSRKLFSSSSEAAAMVGSKGAKAKLNSAS